MWQGLFIAKINQQLEKRQDFLIKKNKEFLPPRSFSEVFGLLGNFSLSLTSSSLTSSWQHFPAGENIIGLYRCNCGVSFIITRKALT